jgi:UTP-glucose-1-phosphate uridylyltransferase
MKKTELLIMAAGMGSRFGGLKQIEPLGPNGEIILDFSVYDAVEAGFNKVVIVIKKEFEKEFRQICGKRIEKLIDVEYVFQDLDKLPKGYSLPYDRQKPWGTGHAVLCAREKITAPFTVINADDFYGKNSYKLIHDWLVNNDGMCMVGYKLKNTLTENGTVCRGICKIENGLLKSVDEHTDLDSSSDIPLDTIVSMNMWGLDTEIFTYLERQFKLFLNNHINESKSEFFLPNVINQRMIDENKTVKVLESSERWYGITYRDDMPLILEAMKNFINQGLYWG